MSDRCYLCNSLLGTGDVNGTCQSCASEQYNNTYYSAKYVDSLKKKLKMYEQIGTPEEFKRLKEEFKITSEFTQQAFQNALKQGF
jgi:DNA polymerase II large subunit